MEELLERLRQIRRYNAMNQTEFAKKIGINQSTYSGIENGRETITDRNIKLICLTFDVNETWLRTGQGDMFSQKETSGTPEEQELLDIFSRLSEGMKEFFLNMGRDLLEKDKWKHGIKPRTELVKREEVESNQASAAPDPAAEKGTGTEG
jgi:transcriptional regulator with XRE-family HTH domain